MRMDGTDAPLLVCREKTSPHNKRTHTHTHINIHTHTHTHTQAHSSPGEGSLDLWQILYRTPALSNEAALGDVQIEHVHGMVDGFDLGHLDREKQT